MKGVLGKVRISRKLLVILGGTAVLTCGTGAAAVFIGADTLLGPSYKELNGLECTEVKTVQIKKKDRYWVRKYITTEPTDGQTRVKTALRVAAAVQEAEKADLVQVVVLDKNGPTGRADMRGRAVGADVLYIPDPSKVPEEATGETLTARYVDKPANESGQFFGEKIVLPETDATALFARLDDKTDCIKPELEPADGHAAPSDGHAAPADHGEDSGHGEAAGHGETDAHGEAKPAEDGHGAAAEHGAPAEGDAAAHGAPAEAGHGEPAAETGGWFSSLKSMVLGGDEAAPATEAGHEAAAPHGAAKAAAHGETAHETAAEPQAPAAGHGDESAEQMPAAEAGHEAAPAHGDDKASASGEAVHEAAAEPEAPVEAAKPEVAEQAEAPAEEGEGWMSSLTGLVWGSNAKEPEEPAKVESSAPDINEHAKSAADADAAGAAWLAKLKSKPAGEAPAEAAQEPHAPAPAAEPPAEDALTLPPKASDTHKPDEHAEAGH